MIQRHGSVNDRSYEEIRGAAIDVLAGREQAHWQKPSQVAELSLAVAEVLARRENRSVGRGEDRLSHVDEDTLQEVFWDLFRTGVVTLGRNARGNSEYPWFRLSRFGKRMIENQHVYFFHDVSSYKSLIQELLSNPVDEPGNLSGLSCSVDEHDAVDQVL